MLSDFKTRFERSYGKLETFITQADAKTTDINQFDTVKNLLNKVPKYIGKQELFQFNYNQLHVQSTSPKKDKREDNLTQSQMKLFTPKSPVSQKLKLRHPSQLSSQIEYTSMEYKKLTAHQEEVDAKLHQIQQSYNIPVLKPKFIKCSSKMQ
ncbi:Hypothetical_protein [Hexamita inflata]|uniref:Hypothetical_protein n=1 Tax=Hexamita inflata TaxID=28002 RepID=A0AA86RPS2_9EUKA|nr:Hypothetical protein HINF_LOCUS66313 [Hexamita inflata]